MGNKFTTKQALSLSTQKSCIYQVLQLNNVEIEYKKQIKLEDQIVVNYSFEDEKNIIAIKSKDQKVLHAIIRIY